MYVPDIQNVYTKYIRHTRYIRCMKYMKDMRKYEIDRRYSSQYSFHNRARSQ